MASCRACKHPRRADIDQMLIQGAPYRSIIAMSGLSLGGLNRHRECIKRDLAAAKDRAQAESPERGAGLLARIEEVINGAKGIAARAVRTDQLSTANSALQTILRSLELLGRLNGELQTPGLGIHIHSNKTVNTVVNVNGDAEIALLIAEATDNFNPVELQRLKLLTETAANRE